jgi:ABC-type multidrug transport system fused ATPase/permease subunit
MNEIKKILNLFSRQERKQFKLLVIMIAAMATLDVLGVASIMPFMAILASPELITSNPILNAAYKSLGFTESRQFLFVLGTFVFALLIISLAFKALTTYAQLRFTLMCEYSIGRRLIEGYLYQPYSWFLSRNSADIGKMIVSEVNQVIYSGVMPMMNFIAHGMVAFALLTLLIIIQPKLALIVGFALGLSYFLIFKACRNILDRSGKKRAEANQRRFLVINEAFGAPKELKLGGLEESYIKRFSDPAHTFAQQQSTSQIISQLPRFALEAISFGGMLLLILYLIAQNGSFAQAIPIIALYAFAGYRLMPALQQIYGSLTQLRYVGQALDALHTDLMNLEPVKIGTTKVSLPLREAITLNSVNYRYPNSSQLALKKLTLSIPVLSTVGFVGSTGSGKTTIVDLIMGLIEAEQGFLKVDGEIINEQNRRAWQRSIGYVPQQIFLVDDSIAANIAFGIDAEEVDQQALERASRIANLHDFVQNELPLKYQTIVGERGVRLSGGQRQRIGIARALYSNPEVLILDEATSALDNLTEQAVMEAVHNLGHEITIIIIAHRLSTVKACDQIFLFHDGVLQAKGTYEQLNANSKTFQKMTGNIN